MIGQAEAKAATPASPAASAEKQVPVTQSKQFLQLKAMLDKKNAQLTDARRKLAKYAVAATWLCLGVPHLGVCMCSMVCVGFMCGFCVVLCVCSLTSCVPLMCVKGVGVTAMFFVTLFVWLSESCLCCCDD